MTLWAVIGTSLLLVISVAAIVAAWRDASFELFAALISTGFNLGLFVCYVIRYACEAWSTIVRDDEDDEDDE